MGVNTTTHKSVTITLPLDKYQSLRKLAYDQELSLSAIIRRMVTRAIEENHENANQNI